MGQYHTYMVLQQQPAAEKNLEQFKLWGFHRSAWLWLSETPPRDYLPDVATPIARAAEPGRDPNACRGENANPLRAPQPRAGEKTRGRSRNVTVSRGKLHLIHGHITCMLAD